MGRTLTIALVCIVAAVGLRKISVEMRDPHQAGIEQAPATLVLVARRDGKQLSDTRLAPFIVSATFRVRAIERAAIATSDRPLARHLVIDDVSYLARGPPIC